MMLKCDDSIGSPGSLCKLTDFPAVDLKRRPDRLRIFVERAISDAISMAAVLVSSPGSFERDLTQSFGPAGRESLQQTFQQQADFAHFGAVVEAFQRGHVDREGAVVADPGKLLD